jgi:molybdopterin synthase catalytic subunit
VEDVVEIKEKPLDIMRYIDAVRDSSAGAIATFSGTTRDTFQGQEVLELRYEAYESMADRELRRICQVATERWDLGAWRWRTEPALYLSARKASLSLSRPYIGKMR